VIIGYLNIAGIGLVPGETNPPLVIDPYAVLAFPLFFRGLQLVAGRCFQIIQGLCCIEYSELFAGSLLNISRELFGDLSEAIQRFGLLIPE